MIDQSEEKEDLLSTNLVEVNEEAGYYFKEAGKWAKTSSIIIGILVAVILIAVLGLGKFFQSELFEELGDSVLALEIAVAVIVVGVFGFMVISLFRFNKSIQEGVDNQFSDAFENGITNLKLYFIIISVFTVLTCLSSLTKLFEF